jgi:hypothetical protein
MPRGGGLNEPTVAEAPRPEITLPRPVKPVRFGDTTVTSARAGGRKSGLLTFLLATLVAGGLLALVGLQGVPWIQKPDAQESKETPAEPAPKETPQEPAKEAVKEAPKETPPVELPKEEPKTAAQSAASPAAAPPQSASSAPAPAPPADPPAAPPAVRTPARSTVPAKMERKPSPMPPAEPVRHVAAPPSAPAVHAVTVITSPAGAKAILDGRADAVCTTPCTLDAVMGRHTIALRLAGYQPEQREFNVGSAEMELPIVVMRAPSGMLMLSSNPSGAAVSVNGRQTGKTTPVQLALAPGSYKITVERDGQQATQNVEVRGGISYLRISFGQ